MQHGATNKPCRPETERRAPPSKLSHHMTSTEALDMSACSSEQGSGQWTYWRTSEMENVLEIGVVRGRQVALPVHFHDEDQLVFVVLGQRRFVMGRALFSAAAGQSVFIPAGFAHQSLAECVDVVCLNFYLSPGCYDIEGLRSTLTAWWCNRLPFDQSALTAALEAHRVRALPVVSLVDLSRALKPVREAAQEAGLTREGYSRRFHRLHGVPPETHNLLLRANLARRGLQAGLPIAEVAAATGFADQSHLGRVFRRVFGVTPGRYRVPEKPVTYVLEDMSW